MTRRVVTGACAAVGAAAGVAGIGVSTAAAAGGPFSSTSPTVFIAQGSTTQLDQAVESNGALTFDPIGGNAGFRYNALAYDTADNYLYAVVVSGAPDVGEIIQIDSAGHTIKTGVNVGAGGATEFAGVFDPEDGELYFGSSTSSGNSLFVYDPATHASSTLTLSAAPLAADFAYTEGYLWGIGGNGIVRIDPSSGTVTNFAIPAGLLPGAPDTVFGAAWTYGSGNLGFSNNKTGQIYQIAVANAGTASPSFSLVDSQSGPANYNNDGASSPGSPVDLSITKTASPTVVGGGGQITYTLTVTNNGAGDSSGYVVNDTLPAPLVNASTSTPGCSISGQQLTCQGNPLPNGQSATITVTANAPTPMNAAITNTATVTGNEYDPNLANNTATATVQPAAGADLAIVKTASAASVTAGGQMTYTLAVTNNGPSEATNVAVSDALPAGETLVSAVPSQGTCAATTCDLGTIADGGQAQVVLTVDVASTASGTITNTATVSSDTPDPNLANNTSSAAVAVTGSTAPGQRITTGSSSDLQIVKTVNHSASRPGQMLTWTLTVTNHGPDAASAVKVVDTPKMAISDLHAKPSQGTCTVGKVLTCELGTIADGGTAKIVVTGKVMKAGTETNSASVTSSSTDPTPKNNLSKATTHVAAPAPRLSLTKTASPTTIAAGGSVTYRITIGASGATAKDLKVCDALPLGLTYVSASPKASLSNGRECWTISSLASGKKKVLILHARALTGTHGTLTNHATASATGSKIARASAKVTVTAAPTPPPTPVTG